MPIYALALDDMGYVVFVEEGQGEYRVEVQAGVNPCGCQTNRTSCRERGLIEQQVNPGPYPFPQLSGILDEGQQVRRPIWTQVIPSVFYGATMPTTRPGESPPTLPISWQPSPTGSFRKPPEKAPDIQQMTKATVDCESWESAPGQLREDSQWTK